MYSSVFKHLLFALPPETAHHLTLSSGAITRHIPLASKVVESFAPKSPLELQVSLWGLKFRNPFGVAAGLDKDCDALELLDALGFGHVEIGTVTPRPQPGNPSPRMFRLPADLALINRLGFPSRGVEVVRSRLERARRGRLKTVVGVNFGKQKDTSLDDAHRDYLFVFEQLKDLGDYFVLNISSPNTPELRKLQEPERLAKLLAEIASKNSSGKPVLFKISPDLEDSDLNAILDLALHMKVPGVIATNTTLSREGLSNPSSEAGGLSGVPLFPKSLNTVSKIYEYTSGKLPIIGVGGVHSAESARRMIEAGASLIQLYTALVYQGPGLLRELNRIPFQMIRSPEKNSLRDLVGSMHKGTTESTTP